MTDKNQLLSPKQGRLLNESFNEAMNRTELITEILKITGYKRSVDPDVVAKIKRALDKYEKSKTLKRMK